MKSLNEEILFQKDCDKIILPAGEFIAEEPVVISGRKNPDICGSGIGRTRLVAASGIDCVIKFMFAHEIKISDLLIHGSVGAAKHGIVIEDSSYVVLDRVKAVSASDCGIVLKDGWMNRLSNCTSAYNGGSGIEVINQNCAMLTGCSIAANGRYGMLCKNTRASSINCCYFEDNLMEGALFQHSFLGSSISGCGFESNGGSSDVLFNGNHLDETMHASHYPCLGISVDGNYHTINGNERVAYVVAAGCDVSTGNCFSTNSRIIH
jgi:parallel beta-helix repeat protein